MLLATEGAESAEAVESMANLGTLIVIAVLLSLLVIHLASRVMGEISVRLGMPSVLGELIGGVLVGSSVLSLLVFPEGEAAAEAMSELAQSSQLIQILESTAGLGTAVAERVFASQSEIVEVLSELGVIILLFEIGLESDLKELIRVGPQAAAVALIGVVVPFVAGTLGLLYLFDVPTIPAVFAGAALTATSIGITARVLAEMQKLRSNEGQVIIGAAVLDDVLGIIILAVVAGLAKTGEVKLDEITVIIISAVAFVVGAIVIGRLLSSYWVSLIERLRMRGKVLIPGLILALSLAYIAQVIQLEAILGAFAAGLILGETEKRGELEEQIKPLSDLFTPIFFVCVGAKTNLAVLDPTVPENQEGLIIAVFLILVAILGKLTAGLGAFGKPGINRYSIGVGMIPRGEVGLVFAGVGAASGALSDSLDASIIIMVIVTTFVAPLWLRSAFAGQIDQPAEEVPSLQDLRAEVTAEDAQAAQSESKDTATSLVEAEESPG